MTIISQNMTAAAPVLELERVSTIFGKKGGLFSGPAKPLRAVDDVSLSVAEGETLGLVGESGSGKSTLGRTALGLIPATSGQVSLSGLPLTGVRAAAMEKVRRQAQMVFQDPHGALDPRFSIGASISEPLRVHGLWDPVESPRKIAGLMRLVGIDPDHADRYPHQFSGGQRQRIGIARALTLEPKLLVLDEPVSALDVSIQAQIINLLQQLQRDRGLAFLFIAHDLAVVRHISHRIAVMYLGKIVEEAPRDLLYERPLHPYTISLLSAVPIPDPTIGRLPRPVSTIGEIGSAAKLPGGCRFHPRCYRARLMAKVEGVETVETADGTLPARCVRADPDLRPGAGGGKTACHYPETPESRSPEAQAVLDAITPAGATE